ncbi:MAG: hypothetical protein DRH57_08000, partial [Candidatus Cloacimonadota bacterium]
MKKRMLFAFAISFVMILGMVQIVLGATIWSEDFINDEGVGAVGPEPPTCTYPSSGKWTYDISNCSLTASSDWFKVTSNIMEARDIDGEAVWNTESIDISCYNNVSISTDASESGTMESADYIRFYYKLDTGSETLFETNGDLTDDFTSATASQTGLNGDSLVIVIRVMNNSGSEYHRFDNLLVEGTPTGGANTPPSITHTPQGNTTSTSAITISADITDVDGNLTTTAGSAPSCWYRTDGGSWTRLEDTTPVGDTFEWDIPGQNAHTFVEYYLAAQDDSSAVTTHPSGGSGTTPPGSTPPASFHSYRILKSSPTIYDVQNYCDGSGSSYYTGETVSLTGIITGIYGTSDYTIQDGSGQWNGIWVHDNGTSLARGHNVTVDATVEESNGLTRLNSVTNTTTNSTGNPLPTVSTILTGSVNTEAYEGVYVFVDSAECTNENPDAPSDYGEWEITSSASSACRVDDLGYLFEPTLNNYYDVTGIVIYTYGNFKIEPRDSNDVVLQGDITPPTISDVYATSSTTVIVDFSEDVDQTSSETESNYSIDNGIGNPSLAVRGVSGDNSKVTLSVSTLSTGVTYTITINNVEDLNGNKIADNSQDTFEYTIGPSQGVVFISEVCDNNTGGYQTAFMEIYNNGDETVDMSECKIERWQSGLYDGYTYTIPNGTTIGSKKVLIVARGADKATFETAWGDIDAFGATYDAGNTSLYFTTGRGYKLTDGLSKAYIDTTDGDIPSDTRVVQSTIGNWTTGSPSGGNPGELDSGQTLPVELSSFTAEFLNNKPTLYWTTQSETDNLGWNVYRAETDNFTQSIKINPDMIEGAGTSSQPNEYSFADETGITNGKTYWYWLESVSYYGQMEQYGPIELTIPEDGGGNFNPSVPDKYGLFQNYPNPFNPNTEVYFKLRQGSEVHLEIYNIKGELIKEL